MTKNVSRRTVLGAGAATLGASVLGFLLISAES